MLDSRPDAGPAASGDEPGGPRPTRRTWRRLVPPAAAVGIYAVLGALVYGAHSPVTSASLPPCACGDLPLVTWFMAWPAHAIVHGDNPFYSTAVAYPGGINLLDNTGSPLLGIVFAPVTWLLGPVAAVSLAFRLGFVLSSASMLLVLRRWVRWWPAAFAGGLLYGFSPFMAAQGASHDFLVFAPLPPVMLALLDELVVRMRHPVRNGVALGATAAAQFLISPEVLAMCAVGAAIGLAVLAAGGGRAAPERWRRLGRAALASGTSGAVVLAYPLWMYLLGPYHVTGPIHPVSALATYHDAAASLVLPTLTERFGFGLIARGDSLVQGNAVEHTTYLGVPLLCLLAVIAIRFRRLPVVQALAAVAFGAWTVTLGPVLHVRAVPRGDIPLPYDLLRRLPLIDGALDVRYALVMYLAVAAVVAVGIDRLRAGAGWDGAPIGARQGGARPAGARGGGEPAPAQGGGEPAPAGARWAGRRGAARASVCAAVAAVALAPLVPRLPYRSSAVTVPAVFTSRRSPIAGGAVVLSYPLPVGYEGSNDQALLWQADAGMRFELIGFRGAVPGPAHGNLRNAAVLLDPTAAERVLVWGLYGQPAPPPPGPATSRAIRAFLARYHVDDVTVVPSGRPLGAVLAYYTAALGRPPGTFDGMYLWADVPRILRDR